MRPLLTITLALGFLPVLGGCKSNPKSASQRSEMQDDMRAVSQRTLDRLYELQPKARDAVRGAAGYAVFTNFGLKIFVAGGGSGRGLATNNRTGAETFMRMAEIQAGLGMGVKKFSLVWVFETSDKLDQFVNSGWELGAQASAAAKAGDDKGLALQGALSVSPGVWLYQLTDAGLALELTAKGTKYYKDEGLN